MCIRDSSTGEPYYEAVAKVNNQLMPLRSFVVDNFSANKYRIFDVNADGKKDLILINDDQGSIIFNVFVYLAETSPESISGVSGLRLARSPKPGTQPKCSLTAENLQASYLKSYSVGACERFTIVVERKYHFCQKSIFETFAYDCTKNDFKELTK